MGSTPTRPERIGSSTVEPVQREGRWFDSSRRPQKRRSSVGRASPRVHCNNELIMTIEKAIEKAIEGGYVYKDLVGQMTFSQDIRENPFGRQQLWCTPDIDSGYWAIEEIIFLDPLFWKSLYGSEKYGRIKAIEFINAIFDGKSAEKFFEQESDLGKEQQEKALS